MKTKKTEKEKSLLHKGKGGHYTCTLKVKKQKQKIN